MSQPLTHVSSHLEAEVTAVAEIVLSVAVAYGGVEETLQVTLDGVPLEVVEAQARAVLDDIGADAIKTGMLGSVESTRARASSSRRTREPGG